MVLDIFLYATHQYAEPPLVLECDSPDSDWRRRGCEDIPWYLEMGDVFYIPWDRLMEGTEQTFEYTVVDEYADPPSVTHWTLHFFPHDPDARPDGTEQTPIELRYGPNADRSVINDHIRGVLEEILREAGERDAVITSTYRDPYNQARVMYDNLERPGGVREGRRLYGSSGDQVIDVYEASKAAGKSREQIIRDMEAKIWEVGPGNVSRHSSDPNDLVAIDVAPSSIENGEAFVEALEAAQAAGRIVRFIPPPLDRAYHIEVRPR
jgi:hypothetical protein